MRILPARPGGRVTPGATVVAIVVAMAALGCSSEEANPGSRGDSDAGAGRSTGASGGSSGSAGAPDGGTSSGGSSTSGAGGTSAGAGGAGGSGAACLPALASCSATDTCCAGSVCFEGKCRETCESSNDCGSLCCAENAAAGAKLCSDAALCDDPAATCSNEGQACTDEPCCAGLTCVESEISGWAGCRAPCNGDDECSTGCCVPFANVDNGFCAEARFCACATLDETCGGSTRCCDGLACTTFDNSGQFGCRPLCQNHGDCDTNCCVEVVGTGEMACVDAGFCQ